MSQAKADGAAVSEQGARSVPRPESPTRNERLAWAENLRREFTANVSHEMKTPLQVISGYAELMANGLVPPDDMRKFAGLIYEEAQAMRALINDVLVLSHLDETAPGAETRNPVNLASVAERVVHRLEAPAREAQVVVELSADPVEVLGNETLLEQMIYNLVENAVRYNEEGGTVRVSVSAELPRADQCETRGKGCGDSEAEPPGEAVIRVADTGPGIPAAAQEKIFERFYRLDKSRSKETGGTGLGLAIVKHAALYHNGEVTLESEEGRGTTFTVRLPLA
ncbi:MAG: hypothetical protein HFJ72_06770, partial [Adlercreutzia sp.]|nr:hypothetical protein [Adlercreutzia sp.]